MRRVDYKKYRSRILPYIERAAIKNKHDFSGCVDSALLSGRAFLFVNGDGFVALEPYDGDKVNIAFAYSFSTGCASRYQPEIERLSRLIGAKVLTFDTALSGSFGALVESLGYKKAAQKDNVVTYVKELISGRK